MSYYGAGDYYQAGDYYRAGDHYGAYAAGGIFSAIGKGLKGLAGGVAGFLTGGPGGAIKGAAGGLGLIPSYGRPVIGPTNPGAMTLPEPGITGIVHRLAPGGKTGLGRLKKDGSFTDRRRPRMNPLNPRALQRALRREAGFLKFARRVGHFAGVKGHFKLKRKRK